MKNFLRNILFVSLWLPVVGFGASFDCKKAATKVESMICSDPDMSLADEKMNSLYSKLKQASPNLLSEQKNWLKQRNACIDIECLRLIITERNNVLTAMSLAGTTSASSNSLDSANKSSISASTSVSDQSISDTPTIKTGENYSGQDPTKFDIVGIRLGMTVDEVLSALNVHNQLLTARVYKVKTSSGLEKIIITARRVDKFGNNVNGGFGEIIDVGFTKVEPHISYVVLRYLNYPFDKQPVKKDTELQLKDKYSEPSASDTLIGGHILWFFGKDNKKMMPPAFANLFGRGIFSQCSHINDNGGGLLQTPFDGDGHTITIPMSISDECGTSLQIMMGVGATNDFVSKIEERLFSDKIAFEDSQKSQEIEQKFGEQKRLQEIEHARTIKPTL